MREVVEVTGDCANWIRMLARRYNQQGPEALADQLQHNSGGPSLLSVDQQGRLQHLLEYSPPDGGLWTGPKVARWMGEQLGSTVHPQRGWEALKRLGFSLQIPLCWLLPRSGGQRANFQRYPKVLRVAISAR